MKTLFTYILLGLVFFVGQNKVIAQPYPITFEEGTFKWTWDENGNKVYPTPLKTYFPWAGFDSSPYKEYGYYVQDGSGKKYMNMRLLFPNGYDSSAADLQQYPMLIMLHGAGEGGWAWTGHHDFQNPNSPTFDPDKIDNNDRQLLWGGKVHLDARNRDPSDHRAFPGFVFFPQRRYNGFDSYDPMLIEILEYLIDHLKIDPNRIYIHGLSAGGAGTFKFLSERPDLFAAAIPMCPSSTGGDYDKIAKIPLWLFYGGEDPEVSVSSMEDVLGYIRDEGGNPKSTFYPEADHGGVWKNAFQEDDFYSWLLGQSKLNIYVYDKTEYCPGDAVNTKLAVSEGFLEYEWSYDGTPIPGSNSYTITASSLGEYRVRFRRSSGWTEWSDPVNITIKAPTTTPSIVALGSATLGTNLDGAPNVTLSAPDNQESYLWSTGETSQTINVSAGSYKVSVTEVDGCPSTSSAPLIVTHNAPVNMAAPSSLNTLTASATKINLFWEDNTDHETGFEIYRSLTESENYVFVTKTKANEVFFADKGLEPGTTYFYQIRAVSDVASSPYAGPESTTTFIDNEAPSRPGSLIATANFDMESITLNWESSTDNVGIDSYVIYQVDGTNTLNSVGNTTDTTFSVTGLLENTYYTFLVKAVDGSGNFSQPSNQASAKTELCGLRYTLYRTTGTSAWGSVNDLLPEQAVGEGAIQNFDIGVRTEYPGFEGGSGDEHFGFEFEGYIYITEADNYTFELSSDDGSVLWIDGIEVANYDGLHGADNPVTGSVYLNGKHSIKVKYFERTSGNSLSVRYKETGSDSFSTIPDEWFCNSSASINPPLPPTDLQAQSHSESQINLTWMDNSNNEYGFELYRGSSATGPYTLIHTAVENATSYSDTGLEANTTYFYKLRAIGATGQSKFTDEALALNYAYYEGPSWSFLPDFNNLTPIKTGKTNNFNLDLRNRDSNFGFVFEGSIVIKEAGDYTFYLKSDDGSELYINDIIVDNDGLHNSSGEKAATTTLSVGNHPIRVEFFEQGGDEVLEVRYSGPGISKQLIPNEALNSGIVSATTLGDTEAPTIPQNLTQINQTSEAVGVFWEEATDNVKVIKYNIYHHFDHNPDTLLASTNRLGEILVVGPESTVESFTAPSFLSYASRKQSTNGRVALLNEVEEPVKVSTQIRGLQDNTNYTIVVTAEDAAGNESGASNAISFKTNEITPLPIVLVSFSAEVHKEGIHLNWETATEINNEVFTIERSMNGIDFRAIGTIPGAGNSLAPLHYTFIDNYPEEGTSYYRLKQTDYNGDYTYSKIVAVRYVSSIPFTLLVYPNPTDSDNLQVKLNGASRNEIVLIKIVDMMGRLHLESAYSAETLSKGLQIDFRQNITPGIYMILVEQSGQLYKTKVIIQ